MRKLICLVPWMAMTTATFGAQARQVEVFFTHFGESTGRAFRLGDECYAPVSMLAQWGWRVQSHGAFVEIDADGRHVKVQSRLYGTEKTIPLRVAIDQLDGYSQWRPSSNTLDVVSKITSIQVKDGAVEVKAGLSAQPSLKFLRDPARIAIDFAGAKLTGQTVETLQPGARVTQLDANTVEVAIEAAGRPKTPVLDATRDFKFVVEAPHPVSDETSQEGPPTREQGADDPASAGGIVKPTVTAPPMSGDPLPQVSTLTASDETEASLTLILSLSQRMKSPMELRRIDPLTIEIALPGVFITLAPNPNGISPSIDEASVRPGEHGTILVVRTVRPMGVEVQPNRNGMQLSLFKPKVGDGKLAGKIVVVDAGHGGHDSGTKALDGSAMEKNIVLAVAKLAARQLKEEGATVIMTRSSDEFISLNERSAIANRNRADFFIAIHVNSNGLDRKSSGSIAFYHRQNVVGQLLADSIEHELAKVSKLPNIGVWSDTRIYRTGFSVLRNAKMAATLLELGFINNARDNKRMREPEFQAGVAAAIVRGLRVYLGDGK